MAANFSRHMGRRSNSLLISGLVSLNGRGNVIEGMLMLCGLRTLQRNPRRAQRDPRPRPNEYHEIERQTHELNRVGNSNS